LLFDKSRTRRQFPKLQHAGQGDLRQQGEFRGVMWADFKGKLVPYANLEPGQKYTVKPFATHPWVFTDGPGNCIEMWVAHPGVSKFAITAKSTGEGGD
jgi:VHL beta domain